jgi:hypothetical protein
MKLAISPVICMQTIMNRHASHGKALWTCQNAGTSEQGKTVLLISTKHREAGPSEHDGSGMRADLKGLNTALSRSSYLNSY